jgi:hypothetical protein
MPAATASTPYSVLVQAAWAYRHGAPRYGLPEHLDPLEGWIVSA